MNVLFALNGATGNRGCEAILLSTHQLISGILPGARFINCSERDERAGITRYLNLSNLRHECHPVLLSLNGLRWQYAKRVIGCEYNFERFLRRADLVMSLGGDNYSLDYGSGESYFRANERILAAGKRLVIWGASIGPFSENPKLERLASEQMKRVWRIVVRETRTKDYLRSLGVLENVHQLPDPAFSLTPEAAELPVDIEALLRAGAIGLNLSPLLARYRGESDSWLKEATTWVQRIVAEVRKPVLLIPHVMLPRNDDAAFLGQILDRLDGQCEAGRVRLLDASQLSSRQLKWVISRLICFVGARTHATIAALSSNVPTLSIGYSVKAQGINEDIYGHDHWLMDHRTADGYQLAARVVELLEQREAVRAELVRRNAEYRIGPAQVKAILSI